MKLGFLQIANLLMLFFSLGVVGLFATPITIGIVAALFLMVMGNIIGFYGGRPMLPFGLTISLAGFALFLNSGGIASIPVALIVLFIAAPATFLDWEIETEASVKERLEK